MTAPLNLTFPQADAIIDQLTTRIHELIGTDYRDAAIAAADRAEAEADRAQAHAHTVVTGVPDGAVTRPKLAPDVAAELEAKADQQAVADAVAKDIATAQRSFRIKLRKDPSQSSYWLPVDLPNSLKGANDLRVMLPAKATWRLTAQGVAGISLRGVLNGAAARTKPVEDNEFVAPWDAEADDWLLFTFPHQTPGDGTEIEVALYETDAFKADAQATEQALADKADKTHTHTAQDVGARPDTWTPTAADVGARPDTWTPTAADAGARPDTWMPTAAQVGARPASWTPTAAQVGAATPAYVDGRIQLVTTWPSSPVPGVLYLMEEE